MLAVLGVMVLLPVSGRSEAAPIRPPETLIKELEHLSGLDAVASGETGEEPGVTAPAKAELVLDWSRHLLLADGRLLLLLPLRDADPVTKPVLPVTVDGRGRWRWGALLHGTPGQYGVTRDGSIWLAAQWDSEAGVAIVHRSHDGLTWEDVDLPVGRATSEANGEMLRKFCVLRERVEIQVEGEDNNNADVIQTWSHGLAPRAVWKLEKGLSEACAGAGKIGRRCGVDQSTEEVVFQCGGRRIAVPKRLKPDR